MNSLDILLQYSYVSKIVRLNWSDILFAVEQGFLSSDAAIAHALEELNIEEDPKQSVIDLACLEKGESIHPYIDKLAKNVSEQNKKETYDKFLYLILNWIYEQKDIYSDPLEAVEIVYADFDYPESITSFVRYMPSAHPLHDTIEANVKRLYDNWENFLADQREQYSAR